MKEISTAKKNRMQELNDILNKAAKVYYQGQDEIMSNFEYDRLYDELVALEEETGIVFSGSPTLRVGYEVLSELPKEDHVSPMLSLDKTKDVDALASWLGSNKGILSWKMDGLTIVLTYRDGKLFKAVTRGNGVTGEVITSNARVFQNLPLTIPYKGELVLRGEAVITYSEFDRINEQLSEDEKYKNPRNLCSGTVRQLNNEVTASRHVHFFAFSLVSAQDVDFEDSQENKLRFLVKQGFEVVEYMIVDGESLPQGVQDFANKIMTNDFPSDGLVVLMDGIAYGESLGRTSKFPRNAMAFKWADEEAKTILREVEWSASRTGLINPVAIFDPVELEGTTVSRASVHNVSILRNLKLGIGDEIMVYKANMIIPQISENLTGSSNLDIPKHCPVCHGDTEIRDENGVEVLLCKNADCPAKKIKSFAHFVSRDAMNLDGISESTIEKLMNRGMIMNLKDLFTLERYEQEIIQMDGFGKKSYDKMIESASKASNTTVVRFLYSLGIPGVGLSVAKLICKQFNNDLELVMQASVEELNEISGVGPILAQNVVSYFEKENNKTTIDNLLQVVHFEAENQTAQEQDMEGINFVITGSVEHFANRNAVKALIEARGGKVTGSVTSKTNYLINNDAMSQSSKNKKAKELGVEIITENTFIEKFNIEL